MAPTISWFRTFVHSQLFVTPPYPTTDCTGKTVIVTGANVGLGKEAARHFVRLNSEKVIIACRSLEKGEAAKKDIEASTSRPGVVEVWQLDLSSYDSVKSFAERAKSLKRLDILLENAGVSATKFILTEDNESTITTNVVSTFLLALLLIPKLQQTHRDFGITPTLTIVSSEVHFLTAFPERKSPSIFEALNTASKARMSDRYNVSKLLEVLICREIAKNHSVANLGFVLNFVNPGLCHSSLTREMESGFASGLAIGALKGALARSTEVGSRTLVHAATQGEDSHGKYLSNCRVAKCAPLVESQEGSELEARVWSEMELKLERIQPGIVKVLEG